MAYLSKDPGEFLYRMRLSAMEPFDVDRMRSGRARDPAGVLREICDRELTARPRQVIRLCVLEGLTETEVARRLGINKSTVSRHVARAKHRIERSLRYAAYPLLDRSSYGGWADR